MNFLAFLLPLGLYLYWFILGKATLTLLYTQRHTTRSNFLAPIVGFSVLQLVIFLPNWFGLPVKLYAIYITIFLFLLSIFVLYWKKPILFCKQEGKFYLLMLAGYTFFAFPLLRFGFHWYSFGNYDMAEFYGLTALNFIHNGFNAPLNLAAALSQKDYTQFFGISVSIGPARGGSMLYLAWLAVCTRLSTVAIFMPLICAQNLLIFSGIIAIGYKRKREVFPLLALLFIIVSPLNTLGVMYQLLGQVGGVALLLGCASMTLQNFKLQYAHVKLKLSVLIAILFATLSISYPEVLPFLIIAMLLYYFIGILRKNIDIKSLLSIFLLSVVFTLLLLNMDSIHVAKFLLQQIYSTQFDSSEILFPYFLKPNGVAILLGLNSITGAYIPYVTSFYILVSFLLLLFYFIFLLKQMKTTEQGYNHVSLVMFIMTLVLFFKTNGFGLFKIAMYIQPFLVLVFVDLFIKMYHGNKLKRYLIVAFAFFIMATQIPVALYYINRSYGSVGSFVESEYISSHNLEKSIKKMIAESPSPNTLYLYTQPNIVISQLLANFLYGYPYDNISRNYLHEKPLFLRHAKDESATQLCKTTLLNFPINGLSNKFKSVDCKKNIPITYIVSLKDILNIKSSPLPLVKLNELVVRNPQDLKNYLVFIDSNLGHDYYLNVNDEKKHSFIGRYGPELDWYFKNDIWQIFGEYSLYQIINPAHSAQLALNLSKTVLPDKKLPAIAVIGANRMPLPIVGYGSARIISSQITPRNIEGKDYIMLDLGPSAQSPVESYGLDRLYNQNIKLDTRRASAYVRSLSLYTPNELTTLKRPSSLSQFPKDLSNPNLFYSGMYEDGWVGNNSYVVLNKETSQKNLMISFNVPQGMEPNSTLTIWLDDKLVATKTLLPGEIKLILPAVALSTGKHKIQLQFSKMISLPAPDNRPVSGLIHFIGFTN